MTATADALMAIFGFKRVEGKQMKTDRELLELAAKAAGYQYMPANGCIVVGGIPGTWNPLTDDGDALRLAVNLGFGITFGQYAPCDIYSVYVSEIEGGETLSVGVIGDNEPTGIVRRAIVRAAAAIGEAMQ